jgi:hypothetical protein
MAGLHFKHFRQGFHSDAGNCHFENDSLGSLGRTDAGNARNVSTRLWP